MIMYLFPGRLTLLSKPFITRGGEVYQDTLKKATVLSNIFLFP